MEDMIIRRGVSTVQNTAMAPGGTATHRVRMVLDPAHWEDSDPFLLLNEDWFTTGAFADHPHRGMETVTYVIEGELEPPDSMANRVVVRPGCAQYMSAGTGIRHAEVNHSDEHGLHIVQMWLLPSKPNLAPAYGQREFSTDDRRGHWLLVQSGSAYLSAPICANGSANSSHHEMVLTGCEPNGTMSLERRNIRTPHSTLNSSTRFRPARLAAVSARRRSGVALRKMVPRGDESSTDRLRQA